MNIRRNHISRKESKAAFNAFIAMMETMEDDKDAFLKAARLNRCERTRRFDSDDITMLIVIVLFGVGFISFFVMLMLPDIIKAVRL